MDTKRTEEEEYFCVTRKNAVLSLLRRYLLIRRRGIEVFKGKVRSRKVVGPSTIYQCSYLGGRIERKG